MMNTKVHMMNASPQSNDSSASGADRPAVTDEQGSGASEQRRRELADFLRTRREKLKPEQVGMTQGARRRTPGLRREEVAELAGVGTTWYTWLEQARDIQPSAEVLRRLGTALQLSAAEVRHMFALAGKAAPLEGDSSNELVSTSMKRFLYESLRVPALIIGGRWDILEMNEPAKKEFYGIEELPDNRRNWLYYVFCFHKTKTKLQSWEVNARRVLAEFRSSVSESLDNPWVLEVVDLMKTESPEFAQWWKEHDVRDNSPAIIEVTDESGHRIYERSVFKPWENLRYKVLVFTPIANTP
jgi:transcriptional regulator with XRE-family HTH domain